MRDRLIELLKKADEYASGVCTDYDEAQEVCAEYLLAEGVIVPPMKLGQIKGTCQGWLMKDALALIKQPTEENERLNTAVPVWAKQCVELEERCMALGAEVADLQDELKCEKETNAHLCSQYMSESHLRHQAEEMLAQGISVVRADTVREMQEKVLQLFPADKNFTTISRFSINQIAKEMLEGNQ
jgi:hypothetical protein